MRSCLVNEHGGLAITPKPAGSQRTKSHYIGSLNGKKGNLGGSPKTKNPPPVCPDKVGRKYLPFFGYYAFWQPCYPAFCRWRVVRIIGTKFLNRPIAAWLIPRRSAQGWGQKLCVPGLLRPSLVVRRTRGLTGPAEVCPFNKSGSSRVASLV